MHKPIAEVINLIPDSSQQLRGISADQARTQMLSADPKQFGESVAGSYALVARDGQRVVLARSLDRPMRYFLAKVIDGPLLIVAERIDQIRDWLLAKGMAAQFHPTYTRMVPAFHASGRPCLRIGVTSASTETASRHRLRVHRIGAKANRPPARLS